jgi:hypothetical protein
LIVGFDTLINFRNKSRSGRSSAGMVNQHRTFGGNKASV